MFKTTKVKILIVIAYFISLFFFELINNLLNFNKYMELMQNLDIHILSIILIPCIEAGIFHFICMLVIIIIASFFIKINIEYKKIIYLFPLLTLIFTLPMSILVMYVYSLLA